jgi:putative signal transducing protein
MNMVTVATFNEREKAEPLRQRLEKAGIHAEVHDEHRFEWLWFVFKPLAGIRLKVHKQDFEAAQKLLNVWDATDGVLRNSVRCPKCKSSRVEYPQFTRKGVLPNFVGLASAFGFIDKEFYCQECQHTWPPVVKDHPPKKHSAPGYLIEDVPKENRGSDPSARKKSQE